MPQSIDGIVVSRPRLPPARNHPPRAVPSRPQAISRFKSEKTKVKHGLPRSFQYIGICLASLILGLASQIQVLGEVAVLSYGLSALIWRIPSRITFAIALVAIVTTTILLIIKGDITYAQSFATYTFLLLVVGVATLIRELKKEGGRIYSIKKTSFND